MSTCRRDRERWWLRPIAEVMLVWMILAAQPVVLFVTLLTDGLVY